MCAGRRSWRFCGNGYEATSLSDLEEATGLGRRSLYNSFGDKRALFLKSLGDFRALAAKQNLAPIEAPDAGVDAVRAVFERLLALCEPPRERLGCLICNTARESIARDEAVAEQLTLYFSRVERGFVAVLKRAQEAGALGRDADPGALGQFYLGVLVSVCVLGRAEAPLSTLRNIVEEALRRIE